MRHALEDASVTIKVLTINGKRMAKGIYQQLPRRSLLAEPDCSVRGTPWGVILDQKCCHRGPGMGMAHWHVLHETDGELAVWNVPKRIQDARFHLRPGEPYEESRAGAEFVDACALETHLGCSDFFQGRVFGLMREGGIVTTVEETKVILRCSSAALALRDAKKEYDSAAQRGAPSFWPAGQPTPVEKAESGLEMAVGKLRAAYEPRGKDARDLYADLVADVRQLKQARVKYAAALEMVGQLPQLFIGA